MTDASPRSSHDGSSGDEGVSATTPADPDTAAARPTQAAFADIASLSYEKARDELLSIVSTLEGGRLDLESSMTLWERGEALAAHCSAWLDGAEARLARSETRPTE